MPAGDLLDYNALVKKLVESHKKDVADLKRVSEEQKGEIAS